MTIFDFLDLPEWGRYLLQGIFLFCQLATGAVVVGRAGKSPYWALLIVIPYVQIAAIWGFAYSKWKK